MAERGQGQPSWDLVPATVNYSLSATGGAGWFGPLAPLPPSAPPFVTGRAWDFQSGYNLALRPKAYEPVGFPELRAFADGYDLLRAVIENRKDQVERLQWNVKPRDQKKPDDRIKAVEAFFRKPDGVNPWRVWLRGLLEDLFVIDAPALWVQRNKAGRMMALKQLDGATIKRVIDDWGRTPQPFAWNGYTPFIWGGVEINSENYANKGFKWIAGMMWPPAYQQILKGLPALDYTSRDLIYAPRNTRVHRAYGYSPVEQIIATINISLRRQLFQLQFYTEGNIPEALIGVPDTWTPDQIKAFQTYWDATFEGNTAQRRHAKFVPGGVAKTFIPTKEPELKSIFDEWLARIVCFCLGISAQPFVSQVNRATAETQKETAEEEGLGAVKTWIKELADGVIEREFDAPDLELTFIEDDEIDASVQETILTGYSKGGVMHINEARDRLGLDPDPSPAANTLMVLTPTGYVPIDAYAGQQAQAQATTEANAALAAARLNAPAAPAAPTAPEAANDGGKSEPQGKPAKPAEVGKAAGIPFVKAVLGPIAYPRRSTRKAVTSVRSTWSAIFARQSKGVASGIRGTLFKAASNDDRSTAEAYAASLDLDLTSTEIADLTDQLSSVASDSGDLAFAQLGSDDMFDQINAASQAWAKDHAATLVSEISDTTRDLVRQAIADGTAEGLTSDEIADNIEGLGAFSSKRSALIANTEIANANSHGALVGYKAAKDTGINVKKAWLLADDDVDDECADNADAGPIDLDDVFPSGDDAPLAHPGCRCSLTSVVDDDQEND